MKTVVILLLLFVFTISKAQSIRKNYLEMTPNEMQDYVDALNLNEANILTMAQHHSEHFTSNIHSFFGTGEYFTAWHRVFLLEMELMIKMSGTNMQYDYLSIPYWDWLEDRNQFNPNFWNTTFLNQSNFSNWSVPFTRNIAQSGSLPNNSTSSINSLFNPTGFFQSNNTNYFSYNLEFNYHNGVHGWIGGTMLSNGSPLDPVFFLHHSMVDKLWQNWEDKTVGLQSIYPNGTIGMPGYNVNEGHPCDIFANDQKDSRSIIVAGDNGCTGQYRNWDVWYAYKGAVILDGANNNPFICYDETTPYNYRYTASISPGSLTVKGDIYVGDLKRESELSTNILPDNKGGFEVEYSVSCNFSAGGSIIFKNGFHAKYGSNVHAKIISSPDASRNSNSINNNFFETSNNNDIILYPNPNKGTFSIRLSQKEVKDLEVIVFDIVGKPVYQGKVYQSEFELNIPNLPTGIFLVRLTSNTINETLKFVKE